MPSLEVRLFGRFSVSESEGALDQLAGAKVQELFAYLLVNRQRPHSRELLAARLWGERSSERSKKYLRQALWQLQGVLRRHCGANQAILTVESDWVQINPDAPLWLDVAELEAAARLQAVAWPAAPATVERWRCAAQLYQGELLAGWYHDWCASERERLQDVYLGVLDKLVRHHLAAQSFDEGLRYASLSLQCDRGRESTHQQIIQLHYLSGDRAAALRQYDRCVLALDEELGVAPSAETAALYDRARRGEPIRVASSAPVARSGDHKVDRQELLGVLGQLKSMEEMLSDLRGQVHAGLTYVEGLLGERMPPSLKALPPIRVVSAPMADPVPRRQARRS
jgi:DNA-binding SARP family transcriptional activator